MLWYEIIVIVMDYLMVGIIKVNITIYNIIIEYILCSYRWQEAYVFQWLRIVDIINEEK